MWFVFKVLKGGENMAYSKPEAVVVNLTSDIAILSVARCSGNYHTASACS